MIKQAIFISSVAFCLLFISCSFQKRHYRSGFYFENSNTIFQKQKNYLVQEKLQSHITDFKMGASIQFIENQSALLPHLLKTNSLVSKNKKHFISPLRINKISEDTLKPRLRPTEDNRVPKAAFRMSMYSLFFLAGALCLFIWTDILFYILLGVFIAAFIFAFVALLTSIAGTKDRIANNLKGIRLARFALVFSILLLCAIAGFFIFTPIIL